MVKKLLAMLMLLCLLPVFSLAEGEFPVLNASGFLDTGEFLYENENAGVWRYCSPTLKVEVIRHVETSPKQTYFVAEVWSDGTDTFFCCPADWKKWAKATAYPARIAKDNRLVLAINGDYYHERSGKNRGIIVRNYDIVNDKTYVRGYDKYPNLDTLSLFANGFMMVNYSDTYTAQQLLDMGARDVLSFGPILIKDGEYGENIEKYGKSIAPRTAIGMAEYGHYFCVMYEGRHNNATGVSVKQLAEKMMELGCTQAMNLDGGNTSGIVFMGKQLNVVGEDGVARNINCRKQSDVVAIGHSDLCAQ